MDQKYNPALRVISTIVLSFFLWTFGGVFEVAYAVKESNKPSAVSGQRRKDSSQPSAISNQQQTKKDRAEEKFSKAIEDIETILKDDKADHETRKQRIKSKKSEIDSHDIEIKKQFIETEGKIKDLPEEIKKRHREFVKHYDDNLRELKTNLEDIDKAKTDTEKERVNRKAKDFLQRVKPPKKHKALDPNKLPHRTEEPVFKEPRTKPEEFEKDSVQQSAFSRQPEFHNKMSFPLVGNPSGERLRSSRSDKLGKPILLAMNGEPTGLLSSPIPNTKSPDPMLLAASDLLPEGSYQLALANPPTTADLAENGIEIVFTPAIRAKAAELGYKPVKIYEWVRNNIEYVPTYGSIQGADMCLQTKLCNDFDTASLLIALLRVSGIHARYAYGTIEVPIEKVKNWAGGFTDSMAALNLLASAGIPTKGMLVGGQIGYVRMEHIWVDAYIDYIPSRGSRHKTGEGDTWIPLDGSFKQYAYTQGMDIKTAVPFDAQTFVDQIRNTATINETQGYVTNVNSLLIQQTMQDYQSRVQGYISQHYPNATVGDVLGKKEIVKQEFPYLLGTLPYRTIVKGTTYANIPDSLRHKITFNVTKDIFDSELGTPINITKSLPELAGKRITLSYTPATQKDEDLINSYLPKLPADGSSIDPLSFPSMLPAYLISLRPELRIDGTVVATGTEVGFGASETLSLTFLTPNKSPEKASHVVTAGGYHAIALDLSGVSQNELIALKTRNQNILSRINSNDITVTKDDIIGNILHITALAYYAELDAIEELQARMLGMQSLRLLSEAVFSAELSIKYFFGIPASASFGGLVMDVVHNVNVVKSLNGDERLKVQFMSIVGILSSSLEHSIPQQFFSTPTAKADGVSAVKALHIANGQGIPIYLIDQSNIAAILPQLQIDTDVKIDIQNAVNAGKTATVSKSNITVRHWTGCGYIIFDPKNGNGAYMISGGLSGGHVEQEEDDGKTFWSVLSTTFSSLRMKNLILKEIAQDKMFNAVAKKLGMFGVIIDTIIDYSKIFADPNLTVAQRWASFAVVTSCAILAAIAVILPLGPIALGLGPMGTILFSFMYLTAILFIVNFIEELALEAIRNSGA